MADLLIKKIQIGSQAYSIYDERVQKPVPANAKFTDTTYGAEKGIVLSQGKFGHSNTAITAVTDAAVFKKIKYHRISCLTLFYKICYKLLILLFFW